MICIYLANQLRDQGVIHVAEYLKNDDKIKYLDIHANWLGDVGCKQFADVLAINKTLECFDISANDMSEEGMLYLEKSLQSNKHVKSVSGEERLKAFDTLCILQ